MNSPSLKRNYWTHGARTRDKIISKIARVNRTMHIEHVWPTRVATPVRRTQKSRNLAIHLMFNITLLNYTKLLFYLQIKKHIIY